MRILFVRHGQSANNVLAMVHPYDEYMKARSPEPPLTEMGRRQAVLLSEYFRTHDSHDGRGTAPPASSLSDSRVTDLYVSPMLRALQTAEPLGIALGLSPAVWVDLHEHGGLFHGNPRDGEVRSLPGLSRKEIGEQFSGYQLPDEVGERGWWRGGYEEMAGCTARAVRVAQVLRSWAETRADDVIMLVAHGTLLDQLLKALLGLPADAEVYFNHLNTAVSRVDFQKSYIAIRYLNRVPHLRSEELTR